MRILFLQSDEVACGIVRADVPARAINNFTDHYAVCKTTPMLSDVGAYNVVVYQRASTKELLHNIKHQRSFGAVTVYDYDDDLLSVPQKSLRRAHKYYADPATQGVMKECMEAVDVITVSTQYLKDRVLGTVSVASPDRVVVVPNSIDLGHAAMTQRRKFADRVLEVPEVVWHGSETHLQDFQIVEEALHRLLEEKAITLRLHGHFTPETLGKKFDGLAVRCLPWIAPANLYAALSQADIGLCPLIDTEFNRAKSNVKWLEYAAAGVPAVVSDLDPYAMAHSKVDCVKVPGGKGAAEKWYRALNRLVTHRAEAEIMGLTAQVRVFKHFGHADLCRGWLALRSFPPRNSVV